jgi:hypothetical protein
LQRTDADLVVRQALTQAYQQTYTSTTQKQLQRLGDASAVALTKIVGEKGLDEHDVEPILLLLELSYNDLRFVENDSDRRPRTTLFVLNYLDLVTKTTKLKGKISNVRSFVKAQYDKSSK